MHSIADGGSSEPSFADRRCRLAVAALERARECAAILEAARVRDFGDAERGVVDEPQGALEALRDQHRMRRLAVYGVERA